MKEPVKPNPPTDLTDKAAVDRYLSESAKYLAESEKYQEANLREAYRNLKIAIALQVFALLIVIIRLVWK